MDWKLSLADVLHIYHNSTGIVVTLLNKEGKPEQTFGEECRYCALFQEAAGKYCPCEQIHEHSVEQAGSVLKDIYIFSCPAGYVHFTVPIFFNGKLEAAVMGGPVSLDYPDIEYIDEVMRQFNLPLNYRNRLYAAYSSAPLVESERAYYLSRLLAAVIRSVQEPEKKPEEVSEKEIDSFMKFLDDESVYADQYEQEQAFISTVIAGDVDRAKACLNQLLSKIYFASGNQVTIIRTRVIELFALLSRAIIECGGKKSDVYNLTDAAVRKMNESNDLGQLSYDLMKILDSFFVLAFARYPASDSPAIKRALDYIGKNYHEPLSLNDLAKAVNLNPSYLSGLFQKKVGKSFSEYLTEIRISQAKYLLRKTDMPIIEVAMEVGFSDQTYFNKVFKKATEMTPKQYRKNGAEGVK